MLPDIDASCDFLSLPAALRLSLRRARRSVGRPLDRLLAGPAAVAPISDDCWGGEACRALGWAYTTPLAGTFILPGEYLTFLENLRAPDAFALRRADSPHAYPVGRTPYAAIHFMHAPSWEEAVAAWARRVARLHAARLFVKIDFGKAGYTPDDVMRWNRLALPNAVALLPPTARLGLDLTRVHRGCPMRQWTHDGAAMFHLSRRSFDLHHWLRTGEPRAPGAALRALHFLLWDELAPTDLRAAFFPPLASGSFRSRAAGSPAVR